MKLDLEEVKMLAYLSCCRFQPGSLEKKLSRDLDKSNVSPRQLYYLYKYCYKYRKQISVMWVEIKCRQFLESNPNPPDKRRESERTLKRALKEKKDLPPSRDKELSLF